MTEGNPIGQGLHATLHPDNSSIYGVRFAHLILQSVTIPRRQDAQSVALLRPNNELGYVDDFCP